MKRSPSVNSGVGKGSQMAASGRCVCIFCLGWCVCGLASGCTVGQKSFSLDSVSKMPFLGLELKERKPKENIPKFNSISQALNEPSRIEPASGVGPLKSKITRKSTDSRFLASLGSNPIDVSSAPLPRGEQSAASETPATIPLPISVAREKAADSQSSPARIDFH